MRFWFQTAYGVAATQVMPIASPGAYPTGQKSEGGEKEAFYKELATTVELEYNLWNMARKSPSKYAEPLANEIEAKSIGQKRVMCLQLYGDGTGVIGKVSSQSVTSDVGAVVLATADTDRGFIGWCMEGDLLQARDNDNTAAGTPSVTGTFSYFKVYDVDRVNNTVYLKAYNSSGTALAMTDTGLVAGDYLYRNGQSTLIDDTSITGDYNLLTENMAGLESLTAADGRNVHSITMSGSSKGTRYTCGGNPLDASYLQKGLSLVKVRAGEGKYSWKQMLMAPEALDALVEAKEVDRRFTVIDDVKRGGKGFGYVHGNDTLMAVTSEFCPKNRIYCIPESKNGKKVLEAHITDFEAVRPAGEGSQFMMRPSASTANHDRFIRAYLEAKGVLVCNHPAAILVVHNFTV